MRGRGTGRSTFRPTVSSSSRRTVRRTRTGSLRLATCTRSSIGPMPRHAGAATSCTWKSRMRGRLGCFNSPEAIRTDLTIRAGYHRPISADCDSRTPGAQGTVHAFSARVEASSRLWKPSTSHCATRESTCGAQSRRSGSANPSIGSRTSPFLTQRSGSSHRVRRCGASCASCLMARRLWPSSPPSALASLAHAKSSQRGAC
jgi:hypothetical protein